MERLDGQTAVVTGGGRGVGRGIAMELAAAGADVMVVSRTEADLRETVASYDGVGGRLMYHVADVEDQGAVERALAATEQRLGPISVLVNNAGATAPSSGPFETLDPAALKRTFENNLWTTVLCTRLAMPGMLKLGHGRVINVASGAGVVGLPFLNSYSVSKAAVIRFTENLGLEFADRRVQAFAITPGMVRTKATEGTYGMRKQPLQGWLQGLWTPPRENIAIDERWISASRVGSLCCFLASGAADVLTGCYFSAYDDEQRMVAEADRINGDELYRLRLTSLDGLERATSPEQIRLAQQAATD